MIMQERAVRASRDAARRRWLPVLAGLGIVAAVVVAGGWWLLMGAQLSGFEGRGFVGRQGAALVRHGAPFQTIGVNFYSTAGDPAICQCGPHHDDPESDIDDAFRRIRSETGASVVRFWAFQSYTNGGTDWRALDRVMRLARKHEPLVIPVLESQ